MLQAPRCPQDFSGISKERNLDGWEVIFFMGSQIAYYVQGKIKGPDVTLPLAHNGP
jgi:hypothetical protein